VSPVPWSAAGQQEENPEQDSGVRVGWRERRPFGAETWGEGQCGLPLKHPAV